VTAPMVPAPEQPEGNADKLMVAGVPAHLLSARTKLTTGVWYWIAACGQEDGTSTPKPISDAYLVCTDCLLTPVGRVAIEGHHAQVIEAVVAQLEPLIEEKAVTLRAQLWQDLSQVGIGWRWHEIGPDGVLMEALRLLGGERS
jgi:hypothetical protein